MSNLNLPPMTFGTLSAKLSGHLASGKTGALKIANETTIERAPRGTVIVKYYGTPIAEIGEHFFTLDHGGWNAAKTAERLQKILADNQTPLAGPEWGRVLYSARNRREVLAIWGRDFDGRETLLHALDSGVAHFSRVSADAHFTLHEIGV